MARRKQAQPELVIKLPKLEVRPATREDIPAVKKLADQNKHSIGFVNSAALAQNADKGWLLVAGLDKEIVGFLNPWHRRDGWTTVMELCVAQTHRRSGIAQLLVGVLPRPVRLKCTVDNVEGNAFYRALDFQLVRTEPGKTRALNIWELPAPSSLKGFDLIFCAGGNPRMVRTAYNAGWLLGCRSDASHPKGYELSFIDLNYKDKAFDFERHLRRVAKYLPRYATVPDLSDKEVSTQDIERAVQQVERLQNFCEMPLVVPKLPGQLSLLPRHIDIGYSVPTSYGGAAYSPTLLRGRRVHLLGGSPHEQYRIWRYNQEMGRLFQITSADGNMAHKCALPPIVRYWRKGGRSGGQWITWPSRARDEIYNCFRESCRNIFTMWELEMRREIRA